MMNKIQLQVVSKWFSQNFLVWLRNFSLFLITYTIIALLIGYTFIYILPFMIGLIMASLAQPLIGLLHRKIRLSRGKSAIIVTALMLLIVFGLIGWIGYMAGRELIILIQRIPEINPAQILAAIETWAANHAIAIPRLDLSFWDKYRDNILSFLSTGQSWFITIGTWLLSVVSSLPIWITMIIVVIFSTFYFSRDFPRIKDNIRSLFSTYATENIRMTWLNGVTMLGKYVRSYLLIYLLTGFQSFLIFSLLRIPFALVWSILVTLFDIFPILGPGAIYVPMAAYYLINGDLKTALFLILGGGVIMVIRQLIEPRIVARSIEIHPLSMLAILLISFKTGSIHVMLYLLFLMITYNLLKNVNLLNPLFPVDPVKKKGVKKTRISHGG